MVARGVQHRPLERDAVLDPPGILLQCPPVVLDGGIPVAAAGSRRPVAKRLPRGASATQHGDGDRDDDLHATPPPRDAASSPHAVNLLAHVQEPASRRIRICPSRTRSISIDVLLPVVDIATVAYDGHAQPTPGASTRPSSRTAAVPGCVGVESAVPVAAGGDASPHRSGGASVGAPVPPERPAAGPKPNGLRGSSLALGGLPSKASSGRSNPLRVSAG